MKTSASKDLITVGNQLSDEEVLGKHKALSHTLSLKSILGKSSELNDFLGGIEFAWKQSHEKSHCLPNLMFTNGLLPTLKSNH